jgi:hypothetical protein
MPDPHADFQPTRIPDPGVKTPSPGSRIRNTGYIPVYISKVTQLLGNVRTTRPGVADPGQHRFLESRIRIRIKSEKLDPVPHSVQIQNVKT